MTNTNMKTSKEEKTTIKRFPVLRQLSKEAGAEKKKKKLERMAWTQKLRSTLSTADQLALKEKSCSISSPILY